MVVKTSMKELEEDIVHRVDGVVQTDKGSCHLSDDWKSSCKGTLENRWTKLLYNYT